MSGSYEFFDHTADMGVRVRAPTMDELIRPAIDGFYATIGGLELADDEQPFAVSLPGNGAATLLRGFLGELLILFEREHRAVKGLQRTRLSNELISVLGTTAGVDMERSALHREVKAVTYHELKIVRTSDGFEATFIVDI